MKDVVEEFNKLSGKSVKRFATVGAGEKAIERFKNPAPAPKSKAKKLATPAAKKPASPTAKNPAVGEAGSYKMRISVDGEDYRSVAVAFVELGLPFKSHIKFRGALKKAGKAVYDHNGKKYVFKLNV
jgi:hypothetical protein